MELLRTLPFVVVAFLTVLMSAGGTNPGFISFAAILLTPIAAVLSAFGYVELPTTWGLPKSVDTPEVKQRRIAVVGSSVAVIYLTVVSQWPIRLCFWMSRPALERVAQQAKHGRVKVPQQAGFFTIDIVEADGNEVVQWLDESDKEQGEPTVLVHRVPGMAPAFTDSEVLDLDSQWYFYSEM